MNMQNNTWTASKKAKFKYVRHLYGAIVRKLYQTKPQIDFSSALTRDIRHPLADIDLPVDVLTSTIHERDQQELLDLIKRASIRIAALIKDLFSAAVSFNTPSRPYSVNELLDKVLTMTQDRMQLKNISVVRSYSVIDCPIGMDHRQLEIALLNIVINAINAMPVNAGRLRVGTKFFLGIYMVSIQDNGTDIAAKDLADINTLFFTRTPLGMATGLATSLAILRANHVRVEVTSEIGRGTCFLLSFERENGVDNN